MQCHLTILAAFLRFLASSSSLSRFRFLSLLCFLSLSLAMVAAPPRQAAG